MPRPARVDSNERWFHVVNRGAARQPIFHDDRDRIEFERLLGLAHARHGIVVHTYAWMTNHYHLLLECPDGHLSDAMHLVASLYVRHFNDRHGRDGPLFRDRFFARPVDSDGYLVQLVRYIHRNPRAIVGDSGLPGYRWSSWRAYMGARRAQPWLQTERVMDLVGSKTALRELVMQAGPIPSGTRLDAETWLGMVGVVADEHAELGGRRVGRYLATMLLDRLAEPTRSELAEVLAFPTKRAHQMAVLRARRLSEADPAWAGAVDEILEAAA